MGGAVPVPASDVWHDELDRHGAPPDAPLMSRHELVDTPDKLGALLRDAGFGVVSVEPVACHHSPTMARFIEHYSSLGYAARRLAGLAPAARAEFLVAVRTRLATLGPDDFADRRGVVVGVASAR